MRFGYITNGFRDHALEDALAILAGEGYQGVGITLDTGHLHPYRAGRKDVLQVRDALRRLGLEAVVETGARYVLDPRRKHWPTLISAEGRERRMDFLLRSLDIAGTLGARVLSLWSGARDPAVGEEESWRHLTEGLRFLEREARGRGIVLAFEPEPGMLVGDLMLWRRLRERLSAREAPALKLTLDLGHLQCTEEPPLDRWIRENASDLANVHLEDIRGRNHEHLFFGDGQMDFPPLLAALEEIRYEGLALVELGRHSHAAPECAARAIRILRGHLGAGRSPGPDRITAVP